MEHTFRSYGLSRSLQAFEEGSESTATGNGTLLGIPLDWVEKHQAYCSLLAFACCSVATLISVYAIYGHLRHYGRPNLQRFIVRIIVIVPVYSVSSWFTFNLVHHTSALYLETIRDANELAA